MDLISGSISNEIPNEVWYFEVHIATFGLKVNEENIKLIVNKQKVYSLTLKLYRTV